MTTNPENPGSSSQDLEASDDDKVKVLNLLLYECCIDPSTKRDDETLLLMSLRTQQSDAFILRLIKMECDANARNKYGKTALHVAIKRPTMTVAQELLESGADINAQDTNKFTPLHYAVMKSHEAVCLLLYYGADVNVMCCHNMLPLNLALFSKEFESAEILMNYYDDQGIFEDFDLFLDEYSKALENLLSSDNSDLFKLVWKRIDHYALSELKEPFLVYFLSQCTFSVTQWIDCLELILQSAVAVDLIEHFNDYVHRTYRYSFISMLLYTLYRRNVKKNDRVCIIYLTLSLGSEVYINDVNCIYELYGADEELDAFIFAADYQRSFAATYSPNTFYFILLPFVFGLEDGFDSATLLRLFENQLKSHLRGDARTKQERVVHALRFFSVPAATKQQMLRLCPRHLSAYDFVAEELEALPKFPTLMELTRNVLYKVVGPMQKMEQAYQFHAAVRKLELPRLLTDVVLFKRPLY